jgi:Tfp pilus assembly ATPase PilU
VFVAQGAAQYGMQTFDQCLLALYRDGIITYETAKESASSPDDFDLKVRGIFSTGELTLERDPSKGAAPTPPAPSAAASPFARKP